ncbi:YadA-like family protein [Sneathia sanguinegens]|uniref:YadA-like family protein n=1 Tax=Sneathia sanguinegens TaxID=40543 RepID=UPI0023F89DB3|nr:YadA-like family protein [Sneathia sanguinegens]
MKNEALKFLKKICKNRVKVNRKMVIYFFMTGGLLLSQANFSESVDETKTATIKDLKDYDYPNSLHFVSVQYSKEDVEEYKDYYKYLDLLKKRLEYLKEIALEKINKNNKKIKELKEEEKKVRVLMEKLKQGNKLISQKVPNEIERNFKTQKNSDKDKAIEGINNEYTERMNEINKLSSNFNNLGIDFAHSIAIGKGAEISGENGIAIGVDTLSGKDSISLGKAANADGEGNIAIGRDATLYSKTFKGKIGQQIAGILKNPDTIIKFENEGDVEYKKSIAIGDGTKSSGNSNIAIGDNAIAMKKRLTLISLSEGGTLSDKNGAEIDAKNWNDIAKQFYSDPYDQDKREYKFEVKPVENAIALGKNASAFADNVIAIGKGAISGFESAVSIGENADTEGKNSVAIGKNSIIFGESSVAIGEGSRTGKIKYVIKTIKGKDTVEKTEEFDTLEAAKQELEKKNDIPRKIYRIEVGGEKSENSVAIGKGSAVEHSGSVAIGAGSLAVKSDGKSAFTEVEHTSGETVSFGNENTKRRLTNVADGKDSSDAVTVAQLQKAIADNKGGSGGSTVDSKLKLSDGKQTNPTTKDLNIKDETLELVDGTNTTVTLTKDDANKKATFKVDVKGELKEITSISSGENKAKITLNENDITVNKKIKGLEAGTEDTDAINKKQFDKELAKKANATDLSGYATTNLANITEEGKKAVKKLVNVTTETLTDNTDENILNLTTENNNDENANAKDYKLSVKKSKIQEIAKDAVEVKSEANSGITVTPDKTTDTKKTTYKLTLDGAKIKELAGTTNVDKTYAKVDGSNIKDLNADNKKAWATGIGASSITDTTKDQLVTGSAVKTYVDGKEITISGDNGNGKLKLDGKLDIIGRSGTNNLEVKTWQHGPNAQPDKQEDYTTENVTTHYETTADGKQQIFVGLKEKPTFKKITLKDGDTKQVDLTPTEDSLSLNNKKLTGLAEATSNTDAINKKQFDEELNKKANATDLSGYATTNLANITEEGKKAVKKLVNVTTETLTDNTDENILNLTTENNNDENANAKDYKLSVKKSKIQEIAKDAVEVKSEANSGITVTPDKTTDTKKTTYKLTLDGAKIKELAGTTNVDKTYAKVDASNLDENNATTNRDNWINKLGTENISETITENATKGKLTTEKAVKDYVKQEIDTVNTTVSGKLSSEDVDVKGDDYISVANDTAKPNHYTLTFDKAKLGNDIDLSNNAKLNEKFDKYALLDGSNLNNDFNLTNWENALGKGTIANNSNGLVKGSTVYNYMTEFKKQLSEESTQDLANKLNVDADNLSDKGVTNLTNKLGTGEVADGDTKLVTGGKVYSKINDIKQDLDNKYTTLNTQVTTNTNDIKTLKTDVEDLKKTKQDITNINTKLEGKLDKADLSIKGKEYIKVDKDDKFNYTLSLDKDKLAGELDLTNNTSVNKIVDTKLGDINTNIGDLKTKVESNTTNIETNIKDITNLKQDMTKKLNVDADNLTAKGETNLIDKLSKDSDISKPNNRLVTDKQVNEHLSKNYYNKTEVDAKVSNISNTVVEANKKSDLALGGVANAVAMANLLQANSYSKYKTNISAAYGYYGGSNALAIGFSGVSENRMVSYRVSGSVNTKGNIALGAGLGVMLGEFKTDKYPEKGKKISELEEKLKMQENEINILKKKAEKTDILEKQIQELMKLIKK